jgi:4-hydroxy-3-methylbut-2-en-1-yl diphosphate reductase
MTVATKQRTAPLVCAAMAIEARAINAGWGGTEVTAIGIRARRLARPQRVATAAVPVVLLGFGGGLDPHQQAGDVVVATAIRNATTSLELAAAPGILGVLRRAGIAASAGPVWSSDHIVRGAERNRLAGQALVADMESARLAAAVGADQLVVVRVVVDTPRQGLVRASLTSGRRARQVLREVASALGAHYSPADQRAPVSGTVEPAAHGTTAATTAAARSTAAATTKAASTTEEG